MSGPGAPVDLSALPHDDAGPTVMGVNWMLLVLSGIFLAVRIYAKVTRHRGLWWDDYALIGAYWGLIGDLIFTTILVVEFGYGKHVYDLDFSDPEYTINYMALYGMLSGIPTVIGVAWSKTSFAITLLRISQGWVKWLLWFIIISMNIAMGMTSLLHWTACQPLEKSWFPLKHPDGKCLDAVMLVHYDMFSGSYSAFMDFFLALLPWYLIKDLQMKKREKLGVAIAMSFGIFAGATATVKVFYLPALVSDDFSYDGAKLSIWGTAEISMTIIAASIPILRVFLRDVHSSFDRKYNSKRLAELSGNGIPSTAKMSRLRSAHNTTISTHGGGTTGSGTVGGGSGGASPNRFDDDSDKSILAGGKIMKTREINIEYHNKSEADVASYEMSRFDH